MNQFGMQNILIFLFFLHQIIIFPKSGATTKAMKSNNKREELCLLGH